MTAEPPAPLTRVRDHSHDPAVTWTEATGPPYTGDGLVTMTIDTVTGWTPPRHHCPDGICADMAAAANLDEQAADHRSLEAWARTVKGEIRRAKAVRGKRVRMLRRALTGAQP